MQTPLRRRALPIILVAGAVLGAAGTAQAANRQIGGTAGTTPVPAIPCKAQADYPDFAPLVMQGSLTGCWYTDVLWSKTTPSGVYLETGTELFIGSLDGGPTGTFTTTYRFEAKFAPDGSEVHGRCQHPLVAGSGTGGFAGATGRVFFKDIIATPVTYVYRGHIDLGGTQRGGRPGDRAAALHAAATAPGGAHC